MRKMSMVMAALLVPTTMACLAPDEGVGEGEGEAEDELGELDEADLDTEASALSFCATPPNPPPYNVAWSAFTAANPTRTGTYDPGGDMCDSFTLQLANAESAWVKVTQSATSKASCEGTTLTVRKYRYIYGAWNYGGTSTDVGVWNAGTSVCTLPRVDYTMHNSDRTRLYVTTKRSYTVGDYSVLQFGLPFFASGTIYVPDVPN